MPVLGIKGKYSTAAYVMELNRRCRGNTPGIINPALD
jgi:hypothetical protein